MDKKKTVSLTLDDVITSVTDSVDKTIGMIATEFKEYQSLLSEEELNAENRKVRNIRENGFINGHITMIEAFNNLKTIISNMKVTIDNQNAKILELEKKIENMIKPSKPDSGSGSTDKGGSN